SSGPDVVVKNGIARLSDSAGSGEFFAVRGGVVMAEIRGRQQTMAGLVRQVTGQLGTPGVDAPRRGGEYDFDISFKPEPRPHSSSETVFRPPMSGTAPPPQMIAEDPDGQPTLRSALQDQLGLKLEVVKSVPVEVVVLDRANREPTGN